MDLKPAVRETLESIVEGRLIVSIDHKARCGYLEEFDGRQLRDPEFPNRKMLVPGVFALFRAAMIDQFGLPTEAGRAAASL